MSSNRREFIKASLLALASGTLGVQWIRWKRKHIPRHPHWQGVMNGPDATKGHQLRFGKFPAPTATSDIDTIIVGGGVAGLSAGWWLSKHNRDNFLVLELEKKTGGNSRSGENEISAYPLGAHYLPIPSSDSVYVKEFLKEIGVIKGEENGLPVYDEYHLCADPHERVFFQGRWHDGLLPQTGISEDDKRQYQEFFDFMKMMSEKKGKDGKTAFAIPLDESSRDQEIVDLDKLTMAELLTQKQWNSKTLLWYVNYCMRDDYGLTSEKVSAWAGIHYFASRSGKAANAGRETVLTWPEGNGWLVKKLTDKIKARIKTDSLVHRISKEGDHYLIDTGDHRYRARHVIYAAPRYTAKYVFDKSFGDITLPEASFTPWVVANVALRNLPEGKGQDLSWDNVSYYSPSLGYIVATHQKLERTPGKGVITYYLPLTDEDADVSRRKAFTRDHNHWAKKTVEDLEKLHPGLKEDILSIDICVWGHGMVGPVPGYLWGENREKMKDSLGGIHFAHSDMSGVSIFEEAQYRGIMAARKVLG